MNKFIKISKILVLITLLSSCQILEEFRPNNIENKNEKGYKSKSKSKEKLEIRISCGRGNLKEFLDKGWKVKKEYSEEKICSWKSVPANKKCNMERDKGCKIIKPDKVGKEIFYLLEK